MDAGLQGVGCMIVYEYAAECRTNETFTLSCVIFIESYYDVPSQILSLN